MYAINVFWLVLFGACFCWGYKSVKQDKPLSTPWMVLLGVPAGLVSLFMSSILLLNPETFHLTAAAMGNGGVGAHLLVFALFTAGVLPAVLGLFYWISGKVLRSYLIRNFVTAAR